jgi:hypothetical protein
MLTLVSAFPAHCAGVYERVRINLVIYTGNDPRRLQTPRSGTSTVRLPTPHATAEEAEDLSIRDIVVEEGSALQRALHVVSTDLTRRNSLSHVPELEPAQMSPRKVAGREITQDHAQYLLSYGMMLGIRVTVSLLIALFSHVECAVCVTGGKAAMVRQTRD